MGTGVGIGRGSYLAGWRFTPAAGWVLSGAPEPCDRCGGPGIGGALLQVRVRGATPPHAVVLGSHWCCTPCRQALALTVPLGRAQAPVWA